MITDIYKILSGAFDIDLDFMADQEQRERQRMKRANISVNYVARSAVIAAVYFVLTTVSQSISFGAVQFRNSRSFDRYTIC